MKRLTESEVRQRIHEVHGSAVRLVLYLTAKSRFKCSANEDHPGWDARISDVLRGRGCPECGKARQAAYQESRKALAAAELKRKVDLALGANAVRMGVLN